MDLKAVVNLTLSLLFRVIGILYLDVTLQLQMHIHMSVQRFLSASDCDRGQNLYVYGFI